MIHYKLLPLKTNKGSHVCLVATRLYLLQDNWYLAYHDPTQSKDQKTHFYKANIINSMDVKSPFVFLFEIYTC